MRPIATSSRPTARRCAAIRAARRRLRARTGRAYARQAAEFHLRNAAAWANDRAGADLTDQIDPDFVLGPQLPIR